MTQNTAWSKDMEQATLAELLRVPGDTAQATEMLRHYRILAGPGAGAAARLDSFRELHWLLRGAVKSPHCTREEQEAFDRWRLGGPREKLMVFLEDAEAKLRAEAGQHGGDARPPEPEDPGLCRICRSNPADTGGGAARPCRECQIRDALARYHGQTPQGAAKEAGE